MLIGAWKTVFELEEHLSIKELVLVVNTMRDEKHNDRRFAASLKGIDLDKEASKNDTSFEDIERRAQARANGIVDEGQLEFAGLGLGFEVIEE